MSDVLYPLFEEIKIECGTEQFPMEWLKTLENAITADEFVKILKFGSGYWPSRAVNSSTPEKVIDHFMSLGTGEDVRIGMTLSRRIEYSRRTEKFVWRHYPLSLTPIKTVQEDGKTYVVFPNTIFNYKGSVRPEVRNKGETPYNIIYFFGFETNAWPAAMLMKWGAEGLDWEDEDKVVQNAHFCEKTFAAIYDFLSCIIKGKGANMGYGNWVLPMNFKDEDGKTTVLIVCSFIVQTADTLRALKDNQAMFFTQVCKEKAFADSDTNRNEKCESIIQQMITLLPQKLRRQIKPATPKKPKDKSRARRGRAPPVEEDEEESEESESDDEEVIFNVSRVFDRPYDKKSKAEIQWVGFRDLIVLHRAEKPEDFVVKRKAQADPVEAPASATKKGSKGKPKGAPEKAAEPVPASEDTKEFVDTTVKQDSMYYHLSKMKEELRQKYIDEAQQALEKFFKHIVYNFEKLSSSADPQDCDVVWRNQYGFDLEENAVKKLKLLLAVIKKEAEIVGRKATMWASVCSYNADLVLKKTMENLFGNPSSSACKGMLKVFFKIMFLNVRQTKDLVKEHPPRGFWFNLLRTCLEDIVDEAKTTMTLVMRDNKYLSSEATPRIPSGVVFAVRVDYQLEQEENQELYDGFEDVRYRLTRRLAPLTVNYKEIFAAISFKRDPATGQLTDDNVFLQPAFPYARVFSTDPPSKLSHFPVVEFDNEDQTICFLDNYFKKTMAISEAESKFAQLIEYGLPEIVIPATFNFIPSARILNSVHEIKMPQEVYKFVKANNVFRIESANEEQMTAELTKFFTQLGKLKSVKDAVKSKIPIVNGILYTGLFSVWQRDEDDHKLYRNIRLAPFVVGDDDELALNPRLLALSAEVDCEEEVEDESFIIMDDSSADED